MYTLEIIMKSGHKKQAHFQNESEARSFIQTVINASPDQAIMLPGKTETTGQGAAKGTATVIWAGQIEQISPAGESPRRNRFRD